MDVHRRWFVWWCICCICVVAMLTISSAEERDINNREGNQEEHQGEELCEESTHPDTPCPGIAKEEPTVESKSKPNRWNKWREKIKSALDKYKDCGKNCYRHIIKHDLQPWKDGVSRELFEEARVRINMIHYQIVNNTLYRSQKCWFPMRCEGIEHFIEDALHTYGLPNMEFIVNVGDWPQSFLHAKPIPTFSFSKTLKDWRDIMYPAWAFWKGGPCVKSEPQCLGRWDLKRENILGNPISWEEKKKLAFFVGGRTDDERDKLIRLGRSHPHLLSAQYTKEWEGQPAAAEVKLEDHCVYRYLFNVRGVAASFRHRHLFLCNSLVLHVGQDWLEFYYPSMKPWVHYIPVKSDFSNALQILEFIHDNDDLAQQIATAGHEFVIKHLRMKDITKYWRDLLFDFSKLQTWTTVKSPDTLRTPIPWS